MIRVLVDRHGLDGAGAPVWHEVDDVVGFLISEFGEWPAGARLYHEQVSNETDVTPADADDIQALYGLPGPFHVVVWPQGPVTLGQVALLVFSTFVSFVLAPEPPTATQRNVQTESPNNGLSERTNRPRINGRIPDIYGTVRSTPDLIQQSYKRFNNHVETEVSYMCIGRGEFDIPLAEIRDDTTAVREIAGASVEVYGPYTSPNSGDEPQLRIGNAINTPVLMTQASGAVNGQTLQPSDAGGSYRNQARFVSPNVINSLNSDVDYTAMFNPGDVITVTNAAQAAGVYSYDATVQAGTDGPTQGKLLTMGDVTANWAVGQRMTIVTSNLPWRIDGGEGGGSEGFLSINGVYDIVGLVYLPPVVPGDPGYTEFTLSDVRSSNGSWYTVALAVNSPGPAILTRPSGEVLFDLSGEYTINTLTSTSITLNSPATVNPDWEILASDFGGQSEVMNPNIYTSGERYIGWFTLQSRDPIEKLISNFVALSGLYADDGRNQYRQDVAVRLEAQPVDSAGDAAGVVEVFDGVVVGSNVTRATRALTMEVTLTQVSRYWKVRARRVSTKNLGFQGTVIDEIKWRDLYSASSVDRLHFGNVTTVQAESIATDGALSIKERKLNMLVTRKLPQRVSGSTFTTELYPTNDVADILSAICLDPLIGNRPASEVDFDNLYATAAEIREYFGFDEAAQFCYTFDNDNLSFEETVASIATAVFCTAYRRGSVLRLSFERETEDSAILFNHRNKIPGSEKRTVQFGPPESYDGVEYQYVDPDDDAVVTLYVPEDQSAVNPKRIESIGQRNDKQAHVAAYRAYNRIQYQHTTVEVDCLPEADLLVLTERVQMADNTITGTMDGDILGVEGLQVKLSQPIPWEPGQTYTMFLQNSDLSVESMPVSPGATRRHAILSRPPRTQIVYEDDRYLRTTFIIIRDGDERHALPFILTEKEHSDDGLVVPITAVNYDARYYQNDRDYA